MLGASTLDPGFRRDDGKGYGWTGPANEPIRRVSGTGGVEWQETVVLAFAQRVTKEGHSGSSTHSASPTYDNRAMTIA